MVHVLICPGRNRPAAKILRDYLLHVPGVSVGTCGDPRDTSPDVLLMPMGYPKVQDVRHLVEAQEHHQSAAVIVLSLFADEHLRELLHNYGADAVLPLEDSVHQLLPAIEALMQRKSPAVPEAAQGGAGRRDPKRRLLSRAMQGLRAKTPWKPSLV